MRSFVLRNWVFLDTAAVGLALFTLRLGVLALNMPLCNYSAHFVRC